MSSCLLGAGDSRAAPVFVAEFGKSEDRNGDGWPDGWQRRIDREHPLFVQMRGTYRSDLETDEINSIRRSLTQWSLGWQQGKIPGLIIPESVPPSIDRFLEATIANRCFEIITDGGAVQLDSPTFPISSKNSYRILADWIVEFRDPYATELSLLWLDESSQVVGKLDLASANQSMTDWMTVRVNETNWIPEPTRYGQFRLVSKPDGPRSLKSTIRLDRIRVERVPKVEVAFPASDGMIRLGESVAVECRLKHIETDNTRVGFRVVDQDGKQVHEDFQDNIIFDDASTKRATILWDFQPKSPGYYRLIVNVNNDELKNLTKEISLAVFPPPSKGNQLPNSRIGWSLPGLGTNLLISDVLKLSEVGQAGAFKYSVWLAEQRNSYQESLGWLVERLAMQGVQSIGVIDPPSVERRSKFPYENGDKIGSMLDFPNVWQPMLDPIWKITSLFLSQYQLGWDNDSSMSEHSRWQENLAAVEKQLRATGGAGQLTIPRNLLASESIPAAAANDEKSARTILFCEPQLTASELDNLGRVSGPAAKETWITLQPLSRSRYSLPDRVHDLCERFISLHRSAWSIAWITDPHHPDTGVLTQNNLPADVLVPLCHLTQMLNQSFGFEPIKINELSGYLYRVPNEDRMLLTTNRPGEHAVYFGDKWTATDIWGRPVEVTQRLVNGVSTRMITMSTWPVFLSNIDRPLIQLQQEIVIENPTIENRVGMTDPVNIRIANRNGQAGHGTLELFAPTLIQDNSSQITFDLHAGKPTVVAVPMRLRYDASQNQEPVDIVVTLNSQPPRQFVVHSNLLVGLKDFQIDSKTAFDSNENLFIDLELVNQSEQKTSFECTLVIPGRRRERFHWLHVVGTSNKRFVIPDAGVLRDQTLLLRCEEIGSGRVINHRIVVAQENTTPLE